jgi:hypothetical protein
VTASEGGGSPLVKSLGKSPESDVPSLLVPYRQRASDEFDLAEICGPECRVTEEPKELRRPFDIVRPVKEGIECL